MDEQLKIFDEKCKEFKKYEYKGNKFSIIAPTSSEDMKRETEVLHHAVYYFISVINKGEMCVLFLRKNDNIDTPFGTIALDLTEEPISVSECSGLHNISLRDEDSEVLDFVLEWCSIMGFKNGRRYFQEYEDKFHRYNKENNNGID